MKILHFILFTYYFLCAWTRKHGFESTLGHIRPSATQDEQTEAVKGLIQRIVPSRANDFSIEITNDTSFLNKDGFKLESLNGSIKISGNTGVSVATGFHYYLKYFCYCHVSWEVSQLSLPKTLPNVNLTIILNDRFRYYQNVCTTSYSFVWWNWTQWEKHIDWMALNSFNFVLAFHAQETIWERVYWKLNLTQGEIDDRFSGPAFLSWLRMGNIRGWGGPLSKAWHERSLSLQKKILQRMRSLGIITILPGFAGHVPRAFKRLYPDAHMAKIDVWNSFNDTYCCPYFLDPTEELFKTIGKLFMEEQIAEFGTDHVYNCDSFNEVDPPSTDLDYISAVGRAVYSGMTETDPDAIWVMQGWLFYSSSFWNLTERAQAFVTSVPLGKMIVLDLQSEQFPQYIRLNQYFGQPYIWCMLHNFGGTLGLFGSASIINEDVIKARNMINSTMIGTGLTMEGINQNYVIYDLMAESAWRNESSDLQEWFRNYSIRRYGQENANIVRAWQILKDTVYDFKGIEKMRGQYAITRTPSLNIVTWTWYDYSDLFNAWDLFINSGDNLKDSPGFTHDLVDVTRQALQVYGDIYYNKLTSAFRKRITKDFQEVAEIFEAIFTDLETILSTNEAFLLGPWIESAKKCASSKEEEEQFEFNAKNQITLWGPNGEIMNYANKQWSGIVSDFFQSRWKVFIQALNVSITEGTSFNQTKVKEDMFNTVEYPFTIDRKTYPTEPKGNAIEVAREIYQKYRSNINIWHHVVTRSSQEERSNEIYYYNHYLEESYVPEVEVLAV